MIGIKGRKTISQDAVQSIEKIELVHSGEDFFVRLLGIISNAQAEIHLQTYIFDNDATGKMVVDALKEAASRNVKIYVLLDGYGSASLTNTFINDLNQQGINIRFFSPLFSTNTFYLGRRLHHKVVVADGIIALIGGINIADKYRGTPTKTPWLDYAVQIEGISIGEYLQDVCKNIYFKENQISLKESIPVFQLPNQDTVRIIQNDWLKRQNDISKAYIIAIRNAKKEVIIVGSYFLPGRKLTRALKTAAIRGVKIKLILTGISDVPFARQATSYLYSSFLKRNIELYEWHNSVLHGKVALVDNAWATVGSFNLNYLSSYGSIEMNVAAQSLGFSKILATHLQDVITQCDHVTVEKLKMQKGIFHKMVDWFSYHFVRTSLLMVTYMSYKRL
jgi:cardiolipin synthase A/B